MKYILYALTLVLMSVSVLATDYKPDYKLIDTPEYYTEDLAVSTFNVLDYGIDNSGETDCSRTVQKLLDAAAGVGTLDNGRGNYKNPTGGIVYFPAGIYLFKQQIIIPRGVTIRGDWKRPEPGEPIKGTIFKIQTAGKGTTATSYSSIIMQPSTLVTNLAFWYPDQDPSNIRKYPPTIRYGCDGYWGNDYCNVRHCTFINSYIGIQFSPAGTGGCPNIFDIYGTPLYEGFEMDLIADVGRFDGINFSAKYWENSGLENSPAQGQIDDYLYNNATGIVMRRNDWSYTCNADIEGYCVGFHAQASPSSVNPDQAGRPNGHNYGLDLRGCKTGVLISSASGSGIMFTRTNTPGCETGITLLSGPVGPVQFYGCNIDGSESAIKMVDNASTALMFQDCNITGPTNVEGGHFQAVNNTFSKNVTVAPYARCIFTDNRLLGNASFDNNSLFRCEVNHNTGLKYPKLPEYDKEQMEIRITRPSGNNLYVVTDSEFGAEPGSILDNPMEQKDNAPAIQKALDKAAASGGGIVYLPSGHYRCNTNIIIPTGVELKGSGDIPTTPKGNGAILEVTIGEGDEFGVPFISMEQKSGIRGVSINYPSQDDPTSVKKYPYTIRANADCYIVNTSLRCAYRGIDLFTNKCDNHYVDYIAGHAFKNVARIGGNTNYGVFSNAQCNTIAYACGDESKFGCWPNSEKMSNDYGLFFDRKAYGQNKEDLDFLIIGDCTNEFLYNNFLFGCNKGMLFQSDGAGGAINCRSLGNAVDGAVNTFVIDEIGSDLDLVNSQIVALNHKATETDPCTIHYEYLPACFISTGVNMRKNVTFFSSNNWGSGEYMTDIKGGNVNIAVTNMNASGSVHTCNVAEGASLNLFNGRLNNVKRLVAATGEVEPFTGITSSVLENTASYADVGKFRKWDYNLSPAWEFIATDNLLPRTGWKATAFNDVNGNGQAKNAIDGNASTRWSTNQSQRPGQWFAVEFGKTLTINTVILDTSGSANDGPGAYTVEVKDPTSGDWRVVASGERGGSVLVVQFETCQSTAIRISQNSDIVSGYWSIHEIYVADLASTAVNEIFADKFPFVRIEGNILYVDDSLLDGNTTVTVCDMTGMILSQTVVTEKDTALEYPCPFILVKVSNPTVGTMTFKIANIY